MSWHAAGPEHDPHAGPPLWPIDNKTNIIQCTQNNVSYVWELKYNSPISNSEHPRKFAKIKQTIQ